MSSDNSFQYIVPGSSEKHRRAKNWTDAEMKGLVYVWEEYYFQLKKAKRNAKVYEKMAKRLTELTGEHRHREEIKMKITNMTFQYRKLKCSSNSKDVPDWPYYKAIDKFMNKVAEQPKGGLAQGQQSGCGGAQPEGGRYNPDASPMGLLPEYTGSSDEKEFRPEEEDGMDSSDSLRSSESTTRASPLKRARLSSPQSSLRKRKVRVMEAMLQEQRKVRRAVEETCREVRQVMQQQNLAQVQSLQLQERMMNLLEKIAWPSATKEPNKL
ncbi:myb/SANT-like DNA-binding domain-containing protein 1 [Denticeps clupeoides]|uniref:myb/SANT-like DNA-binding domain-containing protein 1 n=1 Tax=Denticeps clupeoides TaxID=299321 RepID=UPI0010A5A0D9|nr:myb/SANT-like DNA-binding domain-containing protein 1 [Denticeps clupeoides]